MPTMRKVALLRIRQRKVLYVRTKGQKLFFNLGGKPLEGESDEEALTREVQEELNVRIVPGTCVYLETFAAQAHGKPEGTTVQIKCYVAEIEGEPVPSSEIEEIAWFSSADRHRTTVTGQLILEWLMRKDLID